jgi:N-acetylneuraminic acid mutarotase
MKRWMIRAGAGVLGITFAVAGAACGGHDQRAVATGVAATGVIEPAVVASPFPVQPQVKVGTWQRLPSAPIAAPYIPTSVWTGTEMLVFGRVMSATPGGDFDVAAAYNPSTDTWRELPAGPDREGSFEGHDQTVWTGSEMLVWGITNKAFNPLTNRWRLLRDPPLYWGGPEVTVWTGSQMIGWGGGCCDDNVADGLAYTPTTDTWEKLPSGPLAGRQAASGAWTGTEVIVVGGSAEGKVFSDAAAYNPITRSWRRLPKLPEPRTGATATWDGTEILVVGGRNGGLYADGVAYNPSTNNWRRLPAMEFPRDGHVAVWTGSQLLVWGGRTEQAGTTARPSHGEAFDPETDRWSPLPKSPLRGRNAPTGVWTGTMMVVWGGSSISPDPAQQFADGASYTPGTK